MDLAAIAALSASVLGLVAVLRVPATIPLVGFALVVGLAIGHFGAADLVGRPGEPTVMGLAVASPQRLAADFAFGLGGLNASLFALLGAATGAATAWEAVRLKRPLLAVGPSAIIFSLGVLNSTGDRFPATIEFLALVLLLWLVTASGRLRAGAGSEGLRVSAGARSRVLRFGGVLAIVVVAAAALVPPLSSRDASGIFDGQLQRLHTALGDRVQSPGVGFSFDVPLGGSLATTSQVVLTYSYDGVAPAAAPIYLRGANLALTDSGQWRRLASQNRFFPAGTTLGYVESYREQKSLTVHVRMVSPPPVAYALLFHPGQLASVDAEVSVTAPIATRAGQSGLLTVDEAYLRTPPATTYTLETQISTATEAQLAAAGTAYPQWLSFYAGLRNGFASPYRPPGTIAFIEALARKVTADARTPYDKATAIETYLRTNYRYTLTPPTPPRGRDPIEFFLQTSRAGYCQYYATAMGDMLRALGIPARLVNGFGPGSAPNPSGEYTVTSGDAHTWVEVYFPGYGWIPFEPTPQLGYASIARGPAIATAVPDPSASDPAASPAPTATPPGAGTVPVVGAGRTPAPSPGLPWAPLVGALLALVAVTAAAAAWRPRDIPGAWRRLHLLSSLAGVAIVDSDTPQQFGQRVAGAFPALEPELDAIVRAYSEAAYSSRVRPETAAAVLGGWRRIGPELVRASLRRATRLA